LPVPGRYASRTSYSRSVLDFRRFTKRETGVGITPRAAYARVCDRPFAAHCSLADEPSRCAAGYCRARTRSYDRRR
jgi:hypothetical protein